jgi:hypothetical protein
MSRLSLPRHPLPAAPIVIGGGKASAFFPDRIVTLNYRGIPLARLLELCDGATEYPSIRAQLSRTAPRAKLDADHGRLYADPRFYRHADALGDRGREVDFRDLPRSGPRGLGALLQWFRRTDKGLIWVDLSGPGLGDPTGAHIVRALVPGLIPMTFGYGREPMGCLPRKLVRVPRHGAAWFPHPFH